MVSRALCIGLVAVLIAGCGGDARKPDELAKSHPLEKFRERNDEPIMAAADRYQRRLSADGTVPEGALMRAKEQRDLLLQIQNLGTGVWPSSWSWVGPGNIGGRLRPICIHPTNPDIIYVGSASGGVWKTTNGGTLWFPLDDFMASLSIGDMVMHPNDPDTLFAGTGEGFFEDVEGTTNTAAVKGAGIFVTTDAGTTWNQLPSTNNIDFEFVNRLEFDPTDSNTILVATRTGIWRTTDLGANWTQQVAFNALDVKFDPNNPSQVVAGGHHTHDGPYYSTDGGLNWQLANGAGGHRQEMSWAPNTPNLVYAAVSDDPGRIKIWQSNDGGQNFTLNTTGNGIQTWASYNNTIWVDPTDSTHMIVGGVYLYRSTDNGTTFNRQFNPVHADMHRIVPHPDFDGTTNSTVYFATDGGIYRANDVYTSSASNLNNNLGVTQFYGGAINPTTGDIVGGTQDNGTLFYSGDPQDWFHLFGGDGGYGAADPTDPNYFYGEVQRALLHRSTNGGNSASYIYSGPNPIADAGNSSTTNFIPFFMLDPNNPNTMLVACERMWRSTNVKDSQPDWFPIKDSIQSPNPGMPGKGPKTAHFAPNPPYNLSTIAVAEGNSDIIWAGHNNGNLYMTTNGTDANPTWSRVDENGFIGLPDRWISTIAIDRNDHDHVYVAFMGWEDENVWETTDAGFSWHSVTGTGATSLPDAPVSALAIHKNQPGWIYAGTDIGIFSSGDNGQTWSTKTDGPGTVPVEQLHWKDDNTLFAVTHGRGMYLAEVQLPQTITDLTMVVGTVTSGGIAELEHSDEQFLCLHSGPGFQLTEPNAIDAVLGVFTGVSNPTEIDVIIESHIAMTTTATNRIKMRNWNSGQMEDVGTFDSSQTDTVTALLNIDATNYVRSSDGRIEISLYQFSDTGLSLLGYDHKIDRVNVFVR